jgi:hypothetical protein
VFVTFDLQRWSFDQNSIHIYKCTTLDTTKDYKPANLQYNKVEYVVHSRLITPYDIPQKNTQQPLKKHTFRHLIRQDPYIYMESSKSWR